MAVKIRLKRMGQKKMMKQLSGMMGGKGKRRFGGFPGGMPGGGRFPF